MAATTLVVAMPAITTTELATNSRMRMPGPRVGRRENIISLRPFDTRRRGQW